MGPLIQDLRFALRQIRRAPAFAFFVVATLAISVGANTTVFSAVNALLLRPLPYARPDRLVKLNGEYVGRGDQWSVSLPNAADWRDRSRTFQDMAYSATTDVSLRTTDRAERLIAVLGSGNLLQVLGVSPLIGRGYTADEARPGGASVVMLSYELWRSRFAGRPEVVDSVITLDGNPFTVIGVMPEGISYPTPGVDLWLPLAANETTWNRGSGGLMVVGRLRDGVSMEQARQDIDGVTAGLAAEYPRDNGELSAALRPLQAAIYGDDLPVATLTLLGAVAFVLLIACVNVANLLIARGSSREREVAVRTAVGADRRRVTRQLLTESLVLAVLGGVAGLVLAIWGTHTLPALIPQGVVVPPRIGVDFTVLSFTVALTLSTGLIFGMGPALSASRADLSQLVGGRTGRMTRARVRRRNALVMAEVALATTLLVSAGLTIRSLTGLLSRDPGFNPSNLLTMRVSLDANYNDTNKVLAFERRVRQSMGEQAGVAAVGAVDWMPLSGTDNFFDFFVEGGTLDPAENAGLVIITPGYVEAMGMPLLEGRTFDEQDTGDNPPVIVVNRTFARRYWNGNAMGARLRIGFDENTRWRTVVGVVDDVRHQGMDQEPRAEMYLPFTQVPGLPPKSMTFAVRTSQRPLSMADVLTGVIRDVDPNQPVYEIRTMERMIRDSTTVVISRILAGALGLFSLVALLLACLGLFGVLSYSVAQRTYEIGVRSALGAEPRRLLLMVLVQGMGLALAGLVTGLAGALLVARTMNSVLFGVSAHDPLSFVAAAATLAVIALVATWVPAHRAARVDPLNALRTE